MPAFIETNMGAGARARRSESGPMRGNLTHRAVNDASWSGGIPHDQTNGLSDVSLAPAATNAA
jgi:hypothetical protein